MPTPYEIAISFALPNGPPATRAELQEIADRVAVLLRRDGARERWKKCVRAWDREIVANRRRVRDYERRRTEHCIKIQSNERLRDEAGGPPEPGWVFEVFRRHRSPGEFDRSCELLSGWFPPDLSAKAVPDETMPLPVPWHPVSRAAKYAALAAIHDALCDGDERINPWEYHPDEVAKARRNPGRSVVPYEQLWRCHCAETGEPRASGVAGTFQSNLPHLRRWLEEITSSLGQKSDPLERPTKRRGAPRKYTHGEEKIYQLWKSGEYAKYEDLAREVGESERKVSLIVDRNRNREKRERQANGAEPSIP
ncbi:MAG: hypothetical protein IPM64_14075 [Phycisphaerales bacterium]|nr:hypothetical protein [Phycisphaerales bacterium]